MPLYHFSPPAPAAWLARLRLPVPFAVPFPDEAFFFPLLFFSFSVSSAFFAAGDFLESPGFFLCPSCLPGTLCTLSFPACICHLSHASNISHVSAVPPVSQNTASRRLLFSFYILIISFSIPKFREKSNAFLKFSHVCSTFFSDFH